MPELSLPKLPGSLDARFPVLLLPVSVQVKFVQPSATTYELRVRIYPDQLGISTHEAELTENERDAGQDYWLQAPSHDLDRWRALVARFGAPRAQWVLRQTNPANSAPYQLAPDNARWTRAATARGLPKRFSVLLYTQAARLSEVAPGPVRQYLYEGPGRTYDPQTISQPTTEFLQLARVLEGQNLGPDALAVGPAPSADADALTDTIGIGGIDGGNHWTIDFEEAKAKGMAVVFPLTREEYERGFRRLVVLGVRDEGAGAGQQAVQELLTDHYYTDGLQLVPQGTPTNNTDAVAAGYSSRERSDADATFALLTQPAHVDPQQAWPSRPDGQHLATALGVTADLPPLAGAANLDTSGAMAMNRALWPATYGYFLEEMLRPLLSPAALAWTRRFFETYVLARGPVPALRVGAQPYGVLPTTRFSAWEVGGAVGSADRTYAEQLQRVLAQLDATWTERLNPQPGFYPAELGEGATAAGFAAPSDDAGNLLTTLALDATSTEYYQRYLIGPTLAQALNEYAQGLHGDDPTAAETIWPAVEYPTEHFDPANNPLYQEFARLLDPSADKKLGLPTTAPPIFGQTFQSTYTKLADAFSDEPAARRREGVLLDDQPLSETTPLAPFRGVKETYQKWNYVHWLTTASFEEIRIEDFTRLVADPTTFSAPNSLLYSLLRQAVLLEYWAVAKAYRAAQGRPLPPAELPEKELFNVTATGDKARWAWLYDPEQGQPLHAYLRTTSQPLQAYLAGVAQLATLPTAQLERLLAEHLDLGNYRLDAWRLAPVTQRLADLRQQPATAHGSHLGAFGWLEDLLPGDSSVADAADATLRNDPDNLGYIHAPSLTHGTAAAILRQGYKSRQVTTNASDPAIKRMAVDVSSRRVRAALALLEGLRSGLSLGTLLGQTFERALQQHESLVSGALYGTYVPAFRAVFPLADEHALVDGQPAPQGTAPELAERQVVDGAALLRAAGKLDYPYGIIGRGLPPGNSPFADFVREQVAMLTDNLDALGDLAVSEGIYQAARGNPDRAAAVLDGVAKGQFPPTPDLVHPAQRGLTITQRVLLQLPPPLSPSPWPAPTPRAQAAPRLNTWLRQFFPDPATLTFSFGYWAAGNWQTQHEATLFDAGLHPIDLLYLLEDHALQAGSAFDRLLLVAFTQRAPADRPGTPPVSAEAVLTIRYGPDTTDTGPNELRRRLPLLARLRQLLGSTRPARPHDLQAPGPLDISQEDVGVDHDGLAGRVAKSQQQLQVLADALAPERLPTSNPQAALYAAALFGLTEAIPALAPGADLPTSCALVRQAAQVRLATAAVATTSGSPVAVALAGAAALFGPAFRPDVEFAVQDAAYAAAVQPATTTQLLRRYEGQPLALQEWLHGVAAVRETLNQLDKVFLIQGLLYPDLAPRLPLQPAQLSTGVPPVGNPDPYWVGLPWPADYTPPGDALSLVQWLPERYAPTGPQCALWLDEWTETLPQAQQTTALTFHYDQPNAAAPQTVLLVVSPRADTNGAWTTADLLGAVNETLDLAKKRTVEPDALAFTHLATVLPAVVAPVAQQALTFTLDLGRLNGTARFQEQALQAS